MNIVAYVVFFSWIPVIFFIYTRLAPRRALIFALVTAWLYLPQATIPIPGLPDYKRTTATSVGLFLASLVFSQERLRQFRPRWFDIPMLIWCITPFVSSMTNDLGVYDGLSSMLDQIAIWGLPYFIGRACLSDREGLRDLAVGTVIGGLSYVPFALIEMRLSPQLHQWVYGFAADASTFGMTIRYGGYRPLIFMSNGLEVGMYMVAASLIGYWLWASGVLKQIRGIRFSILLTVLTVVTVLCKSTGALMLMIVGIFVLWVGRRFGTRLPAIILLLIAPIYCGVRATGLWDGRILVSISSNSIDADRSQSLEFRLNNENVLAANAMRRPIFGWGGWGRARVYDENGRDLTITDGLWIIALGNNGIVGLGSLTMVFLLPLAMLIFRYRSRTWGEPGIAPAAVLAVLLALYQIDNLSNGMINLIYIVAAGALVGAIPNLSLTDDSCQSNEDLDARAEVATGAEAVQLAEAALHEWQVTIELSSGESQNQIEASDRKRKLAHGYERAGHFLERLGRLTEAVEARGAELLLRLEIYDDGPHDPDARTHYAEALDNLAWLLSNRSSPQLRDPARAVALASEAVRLFPSNPGYQRTLGASLCLSKEWQAAIRTLSRSLSLNRGGTCLDYLLLAIAHAGMCDSDSAQACLRLAEGPAGRRLDGHPDLKDLHNEVVDLVSAVSKSASEKTSVP